MMVQNEAFMSDWMFDLIYATLKQTWHQHCFRNKYWKHKIISGEGHTVFTEFQGKFFFFK